MKKAFILSLVLCMFAIAAQAQDSLCLSMASDMKHKWCFYWGGKEKKKVTVKRLEQQNDTSQKVVYQYEVKPKADSIDRIRLINLLIDTLKLDQVKKKEGKLKKVKKIFSLLGLSLDSLAGIRAEKGSEEYVALLENESTITLFKWSDSTGILSYLRGQISPSILIGDTPGPTPPPPGPPLPDSSFPYKEALISLLAGTLMGAIISLVISRKKPAVVKEPVDSAPVQPVTIEGNAPEIPSGTLKILQDGIDAILKQADSDAKSTHITSKEDVRALLRVCAQQFERIAKENSDQQEKIIDLTKSSEDKKKEIYGLQSGIENKEAELVTQKAIASQAEELLKNEKNKHTETTSKLAELTEVQNTLDAEAAQVKMVATQIKKLVDDMYMRIDKLFMERRSHDVFKAEILKSFMTISLASISFYNIRSGRYTNEDESNINMLAGKPPSDTSRRVGPSTIQSDVDFVAYFLYKLLDDHNAAGIEGFNYKGTYV